jgi:hypothetical protein
MTMVIGRGHFSHPLAFPERCDHDIMNTVIRVSLTTFVLVATE